MHYSVDHIYKYRHYGNNMIHIKLKQKKHTFWMEKFFKRPWKIRNMFLYKIQIFYRGKLHISLKEKKEQKF